MLSSFTSKLFMVKEDSLVNIPMGIILRDTRAKSDRAPIGKVLLHRNVHNCLVLLFRKSIISVLKQ